MQKVIFINVIDMCFLMSRLLLNKMNYNCHYGTLDTVTPLFNRLIHDTVLEFSTCLNHPLLQLDHIPGYTLMHHVQDAIIHNLGQESGLSDGYSLHVRIDELI